VLDFLANALSPINIALALFGVAAGTIIGSIPGLTATMAVAVLVPLTFVMPPDSALILMGAIYTGAIYGGAYAAILLNTPGTPSAIATTFDGYPMAKRGDGDLAISLACLASVAGGLVGAIALLLLAPPLAEAALAFGPVEYFWLAIFGLSLIAALSTGDFLKGTIGACFGLLLAMVGISETSAEVRFTFGSNTLLGGIETVSALIGLYCIPVLIDLVATPAKHLEVPEQQRGFRLPEAFSTLLKNKFNLVRSSVIGTLVGALPGAGGSIAGLVSYSEARRSSRDVESFGKGNPAGVIATESANNATVGGGFIPTLVLGIPGTPPDAVILGALLVQGVRTGPSLFSGSADIVFTFIFGLLLATILMLPVGLLIGRFAYGAIVRAPKAALVPVVAFMTVIGTYAIRNSVSDVVIMIVLGIIGWIASKRGFSTSPIVLGLILGRIAEQGFVQSWTIGDAIGDLWGQFFGRPLSMVIIALTLLSFIYPFMPNIKRLAKRASEQPLKETERASSTAVLSDLLGFGVFAAVALVLLNQTASLNADAAVFPKTIAIAMVCLIGVAAVKVLMTRDVTFSLVEGSNVRMFAVPAIMLASVASMPVLGFYLSALLLGLLLIIPSQHERFTTRGKVLLLVGITVVILPVCIIFNEVFGVPLPKGSFW